MYSKMWRSVSDRVREKLKKLDKHKKRVKNRKKRFKKYGRQ